MGGAVSKQSLDLNCRVIERVMNIMNLPAVETSIDVGKVYLHTFCASFLTDPWIL